jgi:hypothetical protein
VAGAQLDYFGGVATACRWACLLTRDPRRYRLRWRVVIAAICAAVGLCSIGAETAGAMIWSVVPAGLPTRIADSYLQGVSCSGRACMAVGYASTGFSDDGTEGITPFAERWDGRSWTVSMPQQTSPGGTGAGLNAVSCSSASACAAVGFTQFLAYEGPEDSELVERWNGSEWTVGRFRGAGSLSAVSCATTRACIAVGTANGAYGSPPGAVSARWDGKRWLAERIALQRRWYETSLSGVSCGSATSCLAVGYFRSGIGCSDGRAAGPCTRGALVERWNGQSWTVQSGPRPSGARSVSVDQISCAAGVRCTAIGTFTGSRNQSVPFAARWTGGVWISRRMPKPHGGKAVQIEGLSCTSATACTVTAGLTTNAGTVAPFAERWNGSRWAIQPISQPEGAQSATLTGIACVSPLDCTAVGNFTNNAGAVFPLVESRRHATWSMQQPPNAVVVIEPGGFNAVSCTSNSACIAVGSLSDTSATTLPLAEQWDGMTWSVQTAANPVVTPGAEASLGAVSCASQTACTAVGGGPYGTPSLVERWDGASWSIQSTPSPNSTTLDAISCPSATDCTAVGGQGSNGGQPLVEHWDGTAWAIQASPAFTGFAPPLPGFGASLTGVSCTSDTACTAVGSFLNPTIRQALVERWDGSQWSIQNTPTPPGSQGYQLNAVSCASATDCTAVGQSYSPVVAPPTMLAEHWDGSAWTIEPTPGPAGDQVLLTSVSCAAASVCAAIAAPNVVEVWDGASWSIENLPGVGPGVTLNAVSCTSDGSCMVVGKSDADEEPFVERTT